MAWLHSSFMRCQAHEGTGGSFRRGYKVASIDKDNDPDKSDTPLLQETSSKADEKYSNYDWSKNISLTSKCEAFTKTSSCAGSSDKCSSNVKLKSKEVSIGQNKETMEDKKLLNLKKKNMKYEEEEDDSEDEWGFSSNGGYQKVSSNAD